MAVRNEADHIAASVRSVAAQTYPLGQVDIILADGMSTDGTPAAAAGAAGEVRFVALHNAKRSTPAGLNVALATAAGAVILRLDGHAELDPTYLEETVSELKRTGASVAGSRIRTRGHGRTGEAIAFALSHPLVVGGAEFRYSGESKLAATVAFGAYRREVFAAVGSFREDVGRAEDLELHHRIRRQGGQLLLLGQTLATYWCRDTYGGLLRQYFASGRDMARHLRWARPYQAVPALALALEAAFIGAAWARWLPIWVPAAAAAAYAMLLAAVARQSSAYGVSAARTALAVTVVHSGQALGFVYGLTTR